MVHQAKIVTRLKRQLRDRGIRGAKAHRIAINAMRRAGNIKADGTATKKGVRRGNMTAAARARDRKRKYKRGTNVRRSRR